jgi:hypothetical protein
MKFLIFLLILTQSSFAQKLDSKLVSKDKELNFFKTKFRGIKFKKITYYVEKDLQNVTAFRNGKQIWSTNVISNCEESNVDYYGKRYEIRYIKLEKDKLLIVYGKHNYAEIDLTTGKTKCLGSD